jgi:hypothetical protein
MVAAIEFTAIARVRASLASQLSDDVTESISNSVKQTSTGTIASARVMPRGMRLVREREFSRD